MHKTLHRKLTEKHICDLRSSFADQGREGIAPGSPSWLNPGLEQEMNLLREAARDLLQPRPEAVKKLLAMARAI